MNYNNIAINFPTGYNITNIIDDNIDIHIIVDNRVFFSTFFTTKNIDRLIDKESSSYFWATDMIILSDLRLETIKGAVIDIVESGIISDSLTDIGDLELVYGMPPIFGEFYDCKSG